MHPKWAFLWCCSFTALNNLICMPRHKMAGAYCVSPVQSFRPSVLLSFRHHSLSDHYLNNCCTHLINKSRRIPRIYMPSSNLVPADDFWVIPLELCKKKKKKRKFTFRSLSQQPLHIFDSNLMFWCILWIYRLSLNLVPVRWVMHFDLRKKWEIRSFHSLTI